MEHINRSNFNFNLQVCDIELLCGNFTWFPTTHEMKYKREGIDFLLRWFNIWVRVKGYRSENKIEKTKNVVKVKGREDVSKH